MSRTTLEWARNAIVSLISRGTITRVEDGAGRQEVQLTGLDEEVLDEAEVYGVYGFTSVPLEGAQAIVVFPAGDRGDPLVLGVQDPRHRPTGGEPGDVIMHHHSGAEIRITADGDVVVTPATGRKVLLGSSGASDAVTLASEIAALKAVFDAHIHATTATVGASATPGVISPTGTPFPASPGATKVDAE